MQYILSDCMCVDIFSNLYVIHGKTFLIPRFLYTKYEKSYNKVSCTKASLCMFKV